jgi:hypothetical protein
VAAALQYSNDSVPLYIIVFDTSREGLGEITLKMYHDTMCSNPMAERATLTAPQFSRVSNDSAYSTEMTGIIGGVKIQCYLESIATKEHFFHIIIWTRYDKKKELNGDMLRALSSFADISHKKV